MEAMDTNGCFFVDDDLLNFSLDEEDEEQQQEKNTTTTTTKELSFSSSSSDPNSHHDDDAHHNHPFPEFVEEELEWLLNKDAFPAVETCLDILSDNPSIALDRHSPVSVLENSSSSSDSKNNGSGSGTGNGSTITSCCGGLHVPMSYPVGKRSKRRSRRKVGFPDLPSHQSPWLNQVNVKNSKVGRALPMPPVPTDNNRTSIGRRCLHCLADKTPQWRAGPMGPKTLCNACGVRFKSGRLVPEYRPASSPTFSAALHSNSHRKIVEMRRQKQMGTGEMVANEACGYRVG